MGKLGEGSKNLKTTGYKNVKPQLIDTPASTENKIKIKMCREREKNHSMSCGCICIMKIPVITKHQIKVKLASLNPHHQDQKMKTRNIFVALKKKNRGKK